ncbi:Gfo/Idh/MocA family protein [Kocuria rosea]|uniref:Gfo/Idh/MocA family protein n=1 Tax=Kocuria rosea TaxID=1275 RepID=UPI0009E7D9EF|nr:Gfo/Idh/MocA family oxidoreductase [Kocuria polaris]
MKRTLRIAVVGAGLIGRQHARRVLGRRHLQLRYVVDPYADPAGVPTGPDTALVADLGQVLGDVDGVVLATPNAAHREGALAAVAAGVPVLVEKPIADTLEAAEEIVTAAEACGVPVLVGHHRRYSPLLARAAEVIASGAIGDPVAVMGSALFRKPDDYFESAPWRTGPGGGPILINLVHDVDALRALCGEIVRVQAVAGSAARGFAVEDTAALTLGFANGALGTFIVSDAAASARSWEQTSRENPGYETDEHEDCYHVAGTRGSLSVPTLRLRTHPGAASWTEPATVSTVAAPREDPLDLQLEHFEHVLRGEAAPRVPAREGLQSLRVVHAVAQSARTGLPVRVPTDPPAARPAAARPEQPPVPRTGVDDHVVDP